MAFLENSGFHARHTFKNQGNPDSYALAGVTGLLIGAALIHEETKSIY